MFFKAQDTVFRAGRIHGAILTIDWRDIAPVYFNQEMDGVNLIISLFPGDFLRTTLVPGPFEGRGMGKGGEKEKNYQEGYANPYMAGWSNGVLE